MRLVVGAVLASLLGASAASAVASRAADPAEASGGGGQAVVACWNNGGPGGDSQPALRVEPRRCTFYERGEPDRLAVKAKRIHWKRWGPNEATGKGAAVTDVVGNTPIKIRLSRPHPSCDGASVFSKGKFIAPELDRKNGIRLFDC